MACCARGCLADHYGGLTENWQAGKIYCSEQTARLLQHMDTLHIKPELLIPLPMDTPQQILAGSPLPYVPTCVSSPLAMCAPP